MSRFSAEPQYKFWLARLAASLLYVVACSAQAFLDRPNTVPTTPVAGQVVSVTIRGGVCDFFTDLPAQTDITRNGNALEIVIDGVHAEDPILCFGGNFTAVYPLGAFGPGSYTVTAFHRYEPVFGPVVVAPIGTVAFQVSATSIPSSTGGGLALMATLIALVALLALLRQRKESTRRVD